MRLSDLRRLTAREFGPVDPEIFIEGKYGQPVQIADLDAGVMRDGSGEVATYLMLTPTRED
jgi:hypothetical protein